MSRRKGWCPTCGGPLWRTEDDAEPAQSYSPKGNTCRLCWLADLPTWCAYMDCGDYDDEPSDPMMERWRDLDIDRGVTFNGWRGWMWSRVGGTDTPDRRDEANSIDDSPATSGWLPRVWVGNSTDRRDLGERDAVLWYRQIDTVEQLASTTTLAGDMLYPADARGGR